jgi:hypothetical protein
LILVAEEDPATEAPADAPVDATTGS